ncbi:unnamed protein product [Penicillium pancosmium]
MSSVSPWVDWTTGWLSWNASWPRWRLSCKHRDLIEAAASTTRHIVDLVSQFPSVHDRVPQVELGDAIALCGHDSLMWEYVLPDAPEKRRKLTRKMWHSIRHTPDETKAKARCGDLLLVIGETGGLGERVRTGEEVKDALRQHKVPMDSHRWYVEIREE